MALSMRNLRTHSYLAAWDLRADLRKQCLVHINQLLRFMKELILILEMGMGHWALEFVGRYDGSDNLSIHDSEFPSRTFFIKTWANVK